MAEINFLTLFAFLLEKVKKKSKIFFDNGDRNVSHSGGRGYALEIDMDHGHVAVQLARTRGFGGLLHDERCWWVFTGPIDTRSCDCDRTRPLFAHQSHVPTRDFSLTTRPFSHLPLPVHVITCSACKSPKHGEHKSRCDLLFI